MLLIKQQFVKLKDYDQKDKAPKASEIEDFVNNFDTKRLDLFLKEPSDEKVNAKNEPNVQIGWKSLVKSAAKDKKLDVKNFVFEKEKVSKTKIGSILAPSITFELRLQSDDGNKKSAPIQVNLVGFQLDKPELVQPLLDQAAAEYGTLYSPIVNDKQSVTKKASEIKNAEKPAEELQKYLLPDWNIMGGDLVVPITIDVTIKDVVSANDAEGSLTVKFKFERKFMDGEGQTPASTTKEIKLFGFQLPQQ